jgi:hypothetical protein
MKLPVAKGATRPILVSAAAERRDDRFQIAAERAAASYPADAWFKLSATEQSAAIYREVRKLDMGSAQGPEPALEQPNGVPIFYK